MCNCVSRMRFCSTFDANSEMPSFSAIKNRLSLNFFPLHFSISVHDSVHNGNLDMTPAFLCFCFWPAALPLGRLTVHHNVVLFVGHLQQSPRAKLVGAPAEHNKLGIGIVRHGAYTITTGTFRHNGDFLLNVLFGGT